MLQGDKLSQTEGYIWKCRVSVPLRWGQRVSVEFGEGVAEVL